MDNKSLQILVISDLHAIVDKGQGDDSHLMFENGTSEFGESLISYIKTLDKNIDVLICSGDIANKADLSSFNAGWNFIKKIKDDLNISILLCVPGNHDHQSRLTDFSPKHQLQFTSPSFPFECFNKNTHFWAWNWAFSEENDFNAILLNTSAYHGYKDEYKHGRVAIEASDQIFRLLGSEEFSKKRFNLLLCHHHPEKMEHVDNDYDGEQMFGGQYLLKRLQEADVGPWLIIHGHKHFADISYASSSSTAPPTILSAGSVSAQLYTSIKDRTSNQFYILNIDLEKTEYEDRLIGCFETHEWKLISGWTPSTSSNLPARGGFGSTKTPGQLTKEISKRINDGSPFLQGTELDFVYDVTKGYTPREFSSLIKKLEDSGFQLEKKENKIVEIGIAYE